MEKIERIQEIFSELAELDVNKKEVIREQNYVEAADLRDKERKLIDEIDNLVGVSGYYDDLIKLEKLHTHLENLKVSLDGLKKLDYKLKGELIVEVNSEALIAVQKKVLETQQEILNFKKNVGVE
jgi:hypothetical protein